MLKLVSKLLTGFAKPNNGKSNSTASAKTKSGNPESAQLTSGLAANLTELSQLFQGSVNYSFTLFSGYKNNLLWMYENKIIT